MRPLQILMPMGGLGQRFRDEGYSTPKPLIEVDGRPMFMKALNSFDGYQGPKQHIFVIRQDAEDEYGLATSIKQFLPDAQITLLHQNTQGAVETSLLAREFINPELPLIIMDCDFSFTSTDYFEKVKGFAETGAHDGVLLSFDSDSDRYSYARTDENGEVVETAEKKVISQHALAGAYCFKCGQLFLESADMLLAQPLSDKMKEYYISYLYNVLLQQGKRVALAKAESYNSFGTPSELKRYLSNKSKLDD